MKTTTGFLLLLIILLARPAAALWPFPDGYFKLNPTINGLTFVDPSGQSKPEFGSTVAPWTHSTKDGSLFKSFQADWAPFTIGGGYDQDNKSGFVATGPSANLTPTVKSLLLRGVNALTDKDKWPGLKGLLAPTDADDKGLKFCLGMALLVKPIQNGDFIDPGRWRGEFRFSFGPAWQF